MRHRLTSSVVILACAAALASQSAAQIAANGGAATPTAASAAAAAAVPADAAGMAEGAAAVVNDQIITNYDVIQRVRLIVATDRMNVTNAMLPLLEREALNQLIDQQLELQDLRKQQTDRKAKGLILSDKELYSQIDDMAAANRMTRDNFLQQLADGNIDPAAYLDEMRVDGSWDNWMRGLNSGRLAISEREIAQYQQAQAENADKTRYHVEEILIDPAAYGGVEATVAGANELLNSVKTGGGSFSTAAHSVSVAASAGNGGDMGLITEGVLPAAVDAVLTTLKSGDYSPPIITADGVYLIHLLEVTPPSSSVLAALKQASVALPANASAADLRTATSRLNQVKADAEGCDGFEAAAAKVRGVSAQNLGETSIDDLSPAFSAAVKALRPGEISAPIQSGGSLRILAVCSVRAGGDQALSHDQVYNLLAGNRLAQLKRGAVRELRDRATIIYPS